MFIQFKNFSVLPYCQTVAAKHNPSFGLNQSVRFGLQGENGLDMVRLTSKKVYARVLFILHLPHDKTQSFTNEPPRKMKPISIISLFQTIWSPTEAQFELLTLWYFQRFGDTCLRSPRIIRQAVNQNPPHNTTVEIHDKRANF